MRVAVSQFATSSNIQENLASCMRIIDETAACKPDLILLPEFCNTQPWYTDHNQAWDEATAIDGVFLQQISAQAKKHDCYIVLNVTLRRDSLRAHQNALVKSNISVTSCLFSPLGELIHQANKQNLSDHEKDFFINADETTAVITTPFGKLGLLTGSDASYFETARELALNGAQLLCNPMATFTLDHSDLHGPVRACENKVFVVTANKVGALMSHQQSEIFSEQSSIPQEYIVGIGHSQIVAPDGRILAKIANNKAGFTFAEIDLVDAEFNRKLRPDGTDIIEQRRPELYRTPRQTCAPASTIDNEIPETVNTAIFATYKTNEQAIEDVCHYIENNLSDIIQLPELFFIADKTITNDTEQLKQIADLSERLINQISSVLRPFQYVCTSLVIAGQHQAVLINEQGLFAAQQQLHFCQRYQWTALGDKVSIIALPLEQGEINVAMLTADDANIPEMVNSTAVRNVHLLLVPFDIQEASEVNYGLLARAAENRICIVAASREKSFASNIPISNAEHNIFGKNKIKPQKSTGLIANLSSNSSLLTQWKLRKFSGYINQPLVKQQYGKITKALIHPKTTCHQLSATKYSG